MPARSGVLLQEMQRRNPRPRDLRDPEALGEQLLGIRAVRESRARGKDTKPLSWIYDQEEAYLTGPQIENYKANPSCLEKYPPHAGAGSPRLDPAGA